MNYRRNEDKLVSDSPIGAAYNHIYSVDDISIESGEPTEPVTLQEMKDYLRIDGSQDDSPGDEFDFDDELIEDLIAEGRIWVENFTGLHLIQKSLKVVLLNQAGMIELPGPVTSTVVIKNMDGEVTDADTYVFIGSSFLKLVTPFCDKIILEYEAGYTRTTTPRGLKGAIKSYVADHFEYRGDDDKTANERAARKARPYRRLSTFV